MALIRNINEKILIRQIAEGNEKAFEELFYAYHNQVGAYVMGWTKSIQITEEIVMDIFLKLWINKEALKTVERFDNYLFIIARNHTFNALRQTAKDRIRSKDFAAHFDTGQDLIPDDSTKEYKLLIDKAIAQLPPQQQKVYILKREIGLKYDEIAKLLVISPETARKHLSAAIRNITLYVKVNLHIILAMLATNHKFH